MKYVKKHKHLKKLYKIIKKSKKAIMYFTFSALNFNFSNFLMVKIYSLFNFKITIESFYDFSFLHFD